MVAVLALPVIMPVEHRVDSTYSRVICAVPLVGAGTPADPKRSQYAPCLLRLVVLVCCHLDRWTLANGMQSESNMMPAPPPQAIRGPLLSSLILGLLSLSSKLTVFPFTPATFTFVWVSTALCAIWLTLLTVSVARHGKQGLWLLVGAPLVMFWPLMFGLFVWGCHHGDECF